MQRCLFAGLLWLLSQSVLAEGLLLQSHPLSGKVWDMSQSRFLSAEELLQRVDVANIILLGETHDNPRHHEGQRYLLEHIVQKGDKPALALEQFNADIQQKLDEISELDERDEALKKFADVLTFSNKSDYLALIALAYDNQLNIVGANIGRDALQNVIRSGFEQFSEDELKHLAVPQVWNEQREQYLISHMGGVHCGQLRDEFKLGLAKAQRLRDAMMVDATLPYLDKNIVMILGREHARRDIGLPLYFQHRAPNAKLLSIGFVEVSEGRDDPIAYDEMSATGDAPYDLIWFTPRAERDDPCAGFEKSPLAQPNNE